MSSVDDSYKKTSFDNLKWEPTQKYIYAKNSWFKQINLIIFAVACVLILVISITFITLYFNSRETPQKDLFFNDTAARVTTAAARVTFADARMTSRNIPSTTQASKQERSECFSVKNKCPENQECIRLSFHSTCKCSNGFMNDKNDWTNCICPKNKVINFYIFLPVSENVFQDNTDLFHLCHFHCPLLCLLSFSLTLSPHCLLFLSVSTSLYLYHDPFGNGTYGPKKVLFLF